MNNKSFGLMLAIYLGAFIVTAVTFINMIGVAVLICW
jgi:hypothetical protein